MCALTKLLSFFEETTLSSKFRKINILFVLCIVTFDHAILSTFYVLAEIKTQCLSMCIFQRSDSTTERIQFTVSNFKQKVK